LREPPSQLSIVVPTYSEARLRNLDALVDSLRAQKEFIEEAIIVCETEHLASMARLRFSPLDWVRITASNLGSATAARNTGICLAKGDVVAFLDDEVVPTSHWAWSVLQHFDDPEVIGVTGPSHPLWLCPVPVWFSVEYDWVVGCTRWTGWKSVREVGYAWGMNMAFRKTVFHRAGLFRVSMGPHGDFGAWWRKPASEENDFSIRARVATGGKIIYEPQAVVFNRVSRQRCHLDYAFKRAFQNGLSRTYVHRLSGEYDWNESNLLRRMISRLLPTVLSGLLSKPILSLRKLILFLQLSQAYALGVIVALSSGRTRAKMKPPPSLENWCSSQVQEETRSSDMMAG
jgi:glycosyltransferase involved in cell wall biosynthesis